MDRDETWSPGENIVERCAVGDGLVVQMLEPP
jgi:hypothetical protein